MRDSRFVYLVSATVLAIAAILWAAGTRRHLDRIEQGIDRIEARLEKR